MKKYLNTRYLSLLVLLIAAGTVLWSFLKPSKAHWETRLDTVGTFGSPKTADLNGDGVLDVVMTAGGEEFSSSDSAVVAIDGQNGQIIWTAGGRDQLYTNPVFVDLNADGQTDVVVGGRSAQLKALNGSTGDLLWQFLPGQDTVPPLDLGWYNFYTPALLPDLDNDQVPELLAANGGDVRFKPDERNRPPGKILVLSGATGDVLQMDTVPDKKETYLSPLAVQLGANPDISLIFGTGGESVEGHLYLVSLNNFMDSGMRQAVTLASSKKKGFIAPPVVTDINQDGVKDIIVNLTEGETIAVDGANFTTLWHAIAPLPVNSEYEVYGSLAAGKFNNDDIPDFFTSYGIGRWPFIHACRQLLLDGRTGEILFTDSLGFYSMSSPLAVDVDRDGIDEALLSINHYKVLKLNQEGTVTKQIARNETVCFDFNNQTKKIFLGNYPGLNYSSTQWLGDMDGDELTDVIYAYHADTLNLGKMKSLVIKRDEISLESRYVHWNSYMP